MDVEPKNEEEPADELLIFDFNEIDKLYEENAINPLDYVTEDPLQIPIFICNPLMRAEDMTPEERTFWDIHNRLVEIDEMPIEVPQIPPSKTHHQRKCKLIPRVFVAAKKPRKKRNNKPRQTKALVPKKRKKSAKNMEPVHESEPEDDDIWKSFPPQSPRIERSPESAEKSQFLCFICGSIFNMKRAYMWHLHSHNE